MQKFISPISSLLLLLSITVAHAETKQYNIEIVIFEDSSDRYVNSEQWPVIYHPEQLSITETITPDTDVFPGLELNKETKAVPAEYPENNNVIHITHNTTDALAEHVAKLERSSRYNVLLHQSWQQTGLSNEDAVNIQINTIKENNAENAGVTILNPGHQTLKKDNKEIKSNVQGTLKLILGRYLHIHTDLLYKRLNKSYSPDSPALHNRKFDEFEIKSQRRMRSNELHYIDHPLLGILVIVSPIKPPEPVEENKESDELKAAPEA
ncbi:MAG: hypothetical protein KAJ92_02530 [Gammaproteobacteria bacterium]|nr:hypothetical protein [Gammaproteobacteria bacterium]MCK5262528.1 hypothetical protein [Gammaproteobacteria bacterium]